MKYQIKICSITLKYEIQSFNYEEDTKINTFSEAKEAAEQVASASDLDCFDAPNKVDSFDTEVSETITFFFMSKRIDCKRTIATLNSFVVGFTCCVGDVITEIWHHIKYCIETFS